MKQVFNFEGKQIHVSPNLVSIPSSEKLELAAGEYEIRCHEEITEVKGRGKRPKKTRITIMSEVAAKYVISSESLNDYINETE